jgi:hypothetical protein
MGLFAIVPATALLTISFFVLCILRKLEAGSLKIFGYVIAALLWLGAALFLSAGTYSILTGRSSACMMMEQMMKGKMHGMMGSGAMMKGQSSQMPQGALDEPLMKR